MSINYKNKNDIPYFKFLEFSKSIEDQSQEFIVSETMRIFNPDSVEAFSDALKLDKPARFRFRLDLDFKTAGSFIDADTYFNDKEYLEFFKIVLRKRYFFLKKINFDKITLAEAGYIIGRFAEVKETLKAEYEYLYNPPIRFNANSMTAGSVERESFSEHYGAYMEMFYILCKGDFTKFDEISKWDLHRFLFQAEYLIRKRDVENLK